MMDELAALMAEARTIILREKMRQILRPDVFARLTGDRKHDQADEVERPPREAPHAPIPESVTPLDTPEHVTVD